jgi:hypothetical protein
VAFNLVSGLLASRGHQTADLMARAREYALFQEGLYPMAALMDHPIGADFPTSVYPPYALPLFGLFFAGGGSAQGWLVVQGLSLLSLGLISWVGWRCLRFAGVGAGLLGALAPLAISGNSNCLFHGQFSILCMGLVSLQWLLLLRRRPLPAGICWALSMLKPQIGAAFAIPLLRGANRWGLALGIGLLLLLSAASLAYTQVSPLRYLDVWLQPGLLQFLRAGNVSLMGLLGPGALLLAIVPAAAWLLKTGTVRLPWRWPWIGPGAQAGTASAVGTGSEAGTRTGAGPTLRLQGILSVVGALGAYHLNYDNIMLYPALLAMLALALRHPGVWNGLLAGAMALSLWFPVYLSAERALPEILMALTWLLVGLTLLANGPERVSTARSMAAGPGMVAGPGVPTSAD